MFNFKKSLSRRTFLRGTGAVMGAPVSGVDGPVVDGHRPDGC